jgi:hypothetical protein
MLDERAIVVVKDIRGDCARVNRWKCGFEKLLEESSS